MSRAPIAEFRRLRNKMVETAAATFGDESERFFRS
jgi:hypothetical protein